MDDKLVSLNKHISSSGYCSRREADELIESARVYVNGQCAVKGMRIDPGAKVTIDGEPLVRKNKNIVIAFHKPIGITSTTDKEDKNNIISFIDHQERIFPIGRLDKDSSGLILLTNNGDLVNKILREEHQHEKEYVVAVNRPVDRTFLKMMAKGVPILKTKTKPCKCYPVAKFAFGIILTQGLNRQIRRMCQHFGYRVTALQRVRIMNVHLGKLKPGQWRNLTPSELMNLEKQLH